MEAASVAASQATASNASKANIKIAETFDNFLLLLTTQLQNQDPLAPMDSNEFTQQLVQFTGVEQSIATNNSLEQMLALMQSERSAVAVGHLGKMIETASQVAQLSGGKAQWSYSLDELASSATLAVSDASGRVVWTGPGETSAGSHGFTWNGENHNGESLGDGAYTLSIRAADGDGATIEPTISTLGLVTGIDMSGDEAVLLVGDVRVPVSEVRKLSLPDEPA